MVSKSSLNRIPHRGGLPGVILRTLLRVIQFIISLSLIIIFGADLNGPLKHPLPSPHRTSSQWVHRVIKSDWTYGLVISVLSIIYTLITLVPNISSFRYFFIDAFLALAGWLVVFGIWGKNYIQRDCNDNKDCEELKLAAWFALAGWLAWSISAGYGAWVFEKERKWTHSGSWWATIRGGRRSGYPHSNA